MSYDNASGLGTYNSYGSRVTEDGKAGHRRTVQGKRELAVRVTPDVVKSGFLQDVVIPAGSVVNRIMLKLIEAFDLDDVAQVSVATYDDRTPVDGDVYTITIGVTDYAITYAVGTHTDLDGLLTALAAAVDANATVSATYSDVTKAITVTGAATGVAFTIAATCVDSLAAPIADAVVLETTVTGEVSQIVVGRNITNGAKLDESVLEGSVGLSDITSVAKLGEFSTGINTNMPIALYMLGNFGDDTIGEAEVVVVYTTV